MEHENDEDRFPHTTMLKQRKEANNKFYKEQTQANKKFLETMQSMYLLIMTWKENPLPAEAWQIINKFDRASFTAHWYTKQNVFMKHWNDKEEEVRKKSYDKLEEAKKKTWPTKQ
jgi:hypothetical protein